MSLSLQAPVHDSAVQGGGEPRRTRARKVQKPVVAGGAQRWYYTCVRTEMVPERREFKKRQKMATKPPFIGFV
jgi:hypothetical protein